MKILHLIPYYSRATKTGGPAMQLSRLAAAEQLLGHQVTIVTSTGNLDEEVKLDFKGDQLEILEQDLPTVYLRRKTKGLPHTFYYAPTLAGWLKQHLNGFDIVIIHGIWTYFSWVGAHTCQKMGKPYLFFLHGSLDPWALNHHGYKKLPYWHLVEKHNLQKSSGAIVLSQDEDAQVRRSGIMLDTHLVRNGLLFPIKKLADPEAVISSNFPQLSGHPYVFFMSRLHPKKGLEILLKAWAQVKDQYPVWRLVIAGPDEGGYLTELQNIVKHLNLENSVIFPGLVTGDVKAAFLQRAELFTLPSFSEGVPGAVVDALAYEVPVVITPGCHMPEVANVRAGLVVEPDARSIAAGLERLMSDADLRRQMGYNAEKLARAEFDETKVAAGLVDFCQEIIKNDRKKIKGC